MAKKKRAVKRNTPAPKRGKAAKKTAPTPKAEPLTQAPAPPESLGNVGKNCWQRLTPLLVELRLLTPLHLESLHALCDWWDLYERTSRRLREHPELEVFQTDSGYQQRSPLSTQRNEAYANFVKLGIKFGLTPEALRKLDRLPGTGGEQDPIAAFAAQKYA